MALPKSCYLAGPMRGYPRYNFDAFESATKVLRDRWKIEVISPHEMDLGMGFNPDIPETDITPEFVNECVRRDVDAIIKTEGIVFIGNIRDSIGAMAEMAVARWLGRKCLLYCDYGSHLMEIDPADFMNS